MVMCEVIITFFFLIRNYLLEIHNKIFMYEIRLGFASSNWRKAKQRGAKTGKDYP